jgi:hypothetical protein
VERELLFDLWNLLKGEETEGVSVGNLRIMLLAIQGIVLEDMLSEDLKLVEISRTSNFQLKCNLQECLSLRFTQAETSKLFVKFKPLYINRIQGAGQ